jgi:F0F1-type ATP synthase membrane subunit c/vacuolar-type H+-ATPase subunit K
VAVLTSFSWIVVHAAEIASAHETDQTSLLPVARRHHGLLFIASLIGCGLGAHAIGYGAGEAVMRRYAGGQSVQRRAENPAASRQTRVVVLSMAIFVAGCVARAGLSMTGSQMFPPGFSAGSTPATNFEFRDLQELLLGLAFATLALVLGDHVRKRRKLLGRFSQTVLHSVIWGCPAPRWLAQVGGWPYYAEQQADTVEWATLRCNFIASALVGCGLLEIAQLQGTSTFWHQNKNVVLLKFGTCTCMRRAPCS